MKGGRKVMDALLITFLVVLVLSVGGTIISLLLFAHGSEHVSRSRSARRVSLVPRSYITNTNFAIEDRETARYARRTIASLVILLVVLGSFIYSAFHVLVAH
jgi:hypothetical protein